MSWTPSLPSFFLQTVNWKIVQMSRFSSIIPIHYKSYFTHERITNPTDMTALWTKKMGNFDCQWDYWWPGHGFMLKFTSWNQLSQKTISIHEFFHFIISHPRFDRKNTFDLSPTQILKQIIQIQKVCSLIHDKDWVGSINLSSYLSSFNKMLHDKHDMKKAGNEKNWAKYKVPGKGSLGAEYI